MQAFILEIIKPTILAMLLFSAIKVIIGTDYIEGASMRPTLKQGNYVLVNKLAYLHIPISGGSAHTDAKEISPSPSNIFPFDPPNRGEVIVFKSPSDISKNFVKRVIGVPGDTVEIHGGRVFVNGAQLDEPYIKDTERIADNMPPFKVPAKEFFVLGDNRRASSDSRQWGAVPLENVRGRVWIRYWPFSDIRVLPTADANSN